MAADKDLKVQVMMVGGRRCGKTSVLAAMQSNFKKIFARTDLTMAYGNLDTLKVLETKSSELSDYFVTRGKDRAFFPDSNPTDEMMKYSFSVGVANKRGKICVDFVDYPGEWLKDGEGHGEILVECMKESQAIIIAIDTPHMMEEDGRFNEKRNYCGFISAMLTMAFEKLEETDDIGKKLILFVPLKCERYLNDGKMEDVRRKTEEAYAELIQYFTRFPSRYEVAVTPIFTLGGAAFSGFECDRITGQIKIDRFGTPEKARYYFLDNAGNKPSAKYCEQPVVYLLSYIMQLAGEKKQNKYEQENIFGKFGIRLQEWFFHTTSADDYLSQKAVVLGSLKKQGEGYHIIQDPIKFL